MARITAKEAKKLWIILDNNNLKWSDWKYSSNTSIYKWEKFRSNLELERFKFLEILKKSWKILDFYHENEKFILLDTHYYCNDNKYWCKKTLKKTTYTPDFKIILKNWDIIYEDTKSIETAKKESYIIKKKLFIQKYCKDNIFFKEVFEFNDIYF